MARGSKRSGANAAGDGSPRVAVVYARVSTQRQADSGVGMEAQLHACHEHAARLGLEVASVHRDEALSGRDGIEERPGLRAALEAVHAAAPGSAVLVAYSLSRLARRQRLVWHILDDREGLGVPFSSATEPFDTSTPMGRAMLGMLATWAQLESDLARERTVDALGAVRARGKRLGRLRMHESIGPDGARRVDPAKAALVRRAQELFASLGSDRKAAAALNAAGVPTVTGTGKWWRKTVRTALALELPDNGDGEGQAA